MKIIIIIIFIIKIHLTIPNDNIQAWPKGGKPKTPCPRKNCQNPPSQQSQTLNACEMHSHLPYNRAGNVNRGGRGYFWYTPSGRKFSKIPPLEILGQAAILFFK